ncbi:hypothetical protein VMT65_03205 [Nocardia sp. CDC153]|uniref:hypothetical protein n=1 Tax=Nocardia sp. CDC153 TaxID=3112167 RepID=UPI002DB76A6F|nr:hypothetical protein [Nocardia sp. CDC153]MEC3952034.1 hypothetical protein [Nocardia sp. CDC153]
MSSMRLSERPRVWATGIAVAVVALIVTIVLIRQDRSIASTPEPGLTLVSIGADGKPANANCKRLSIDSSGHRVAFESRATNLVEGGGDGHVGHIYLRDLDRRSTAMLDRGDDGRPADRDSWDPVISADGSKVVFYSDASNLGSGSTDGRSHVYLRGVADKHTTRLDTNDRGEAANGDSMMVQISANGRFAAFSSNATNLVATPTGGQWNVYLKDLGSGRITLVSQTVDGSPATALNYGGMPDDSGEHVVFGSLASNLVPGDTNNVGDVFVRDIRAGTTTRISVAPGGEQGDDLSIGGAISGDGRFVGFASHATNLVAGLPGNHVSHAYVRDLVAGTTTLLDVGATGLPGDGNATWSSFSGSARRMVFMSTAGNLLPNAPKAQWNIYRRDLDTGKLELLSANPQGFEDNGENWWDTASGDGSVVGFLSFASDLGSSDGLFSQIYIRRGGAPVADIAQLGTTANKSNGNQLLASRTDSVGGQVSLAASAYAVAPYLDYHVSFTANTSKVTWNQAGVVPDSIEHTDKWVIDFYGDRYAVKGAPDGAEIHEGNGWLEVDWTTKSTGVTSEHAWNAMDFVPAEGSTFGQVYRIRHLTSATVRVGDTTQTAETEDRAFMW